MQIVADENMPNVEAWFASVASAIERKPGRTLSSSDLASTNALLVRSVTQVNASLLENTPIGFVGSATIGTDHIDQSYLAERNIPFAYAPGCNAQSVADWLIAVLCRLQLDAELNWRDKTFAVIGVGNVGSTVVRALKQLGCRVLVCDPFKHRDGKLPDHMPLETVLAQADILCFHTPHTKDGDFPTHGMMDVEQWKLVRRGTWVINAGRGPVFQREPLLAAAGAKHIHLVLDVWPEEPVVDEALLNVCYLASPHVAGYSLEGKYKGTEMLAKAFYAHIGQSISSTPPMPEAPVIDARLYEQEDLDLWAAEIVLAVYDPARDTTAMRLSLQNGRLPEGVFDQLRKEYPVRRELASTQVRHVTEGLKEKLIAFRFVDLP